MEKMIAAMMAPKAHFRLWKYSYDGVWSAELERFSGSVDLKLNAKGETPLEAVTSLYAEYQKVMKPDGLRIAVAPALEYQPAPRPDDMPF